MLDLLFEYEYKTFLFFMSVCSCMLLAEIVKKKFSKNIIIECFTNYGMHIPFRSVEVFFFYLLYEVQWFVVDSLGIFWIFEVSVWSVIYAIVVVDYIFYVTHKWFHEIPILWIAHAPHHSSRNFNFMTYFRVGLFEPVFNVLPLFPLIFLGISPDLVLLSMGLIGSYQSWVHTELVGKLGVLEKILVTPSQHRVHHGCNSKYMDKNYGGVLCIWDRLHGTYEEEIEKPMYGVPGDFESLNPIKVIFSDFPALIDKVKKAKNIREAMAYLFKRRVLNK